MSFRENNSKFLFLFIGSWIILFGILFEFVIPANRFFPAPTLLLESVGSLWNDYDLLINVISSVSVIYISMFFAFSLVWLLKNVFLKGKGVIFNLILSLEWFSEYIPGILIGILLIFWFPQSDYTEFIFSFSIAFASLSMKLTKLGKTVNRDYSDAAISLGASNKKILSIRFNTLMPELSKGLITLHFYVWTMLIVFEFINKSFGMGFILRQALEFNDLSAFISASVITGVLIYLGTRGLIFLRNKFVNWS